MLSLLIQKIKDLEGQAKSLEQYAIDGLLPEVDVLTAIDTTMKKIEKAKHDYVDRCHPWNPRDKMPRTKSRRGESITYYMTHIKDNGTIKQLSAKSIEALYDKLFDFYSMESTLEFERNITVGELYQLYIDLRRKDADLYHIISSRTVDNIEMDWRRFFADSNIVRLNVINVTQRQCYSEFKRITGAGLITKKAFHKAKGILDGIFDIAIEAGIIDYNPSKNISSRNLKFLLKKDNSGDVYTDEERNKLLEYLNNLPSKNVYSLAVQLAFCFPLRIGELTALTWEDYSEESQALYIWHQIVECKRDEKKRVCTDVPFTKTNTKDGLRLLHVSPEAELIIHELQKINGVKKYMLNSKGDMPIKGNHFNEHLKKYCKEAGIPYYSSHKIRFYGATALFDAGVNPEQIRRIMGHTSIKMTEHYNRTRGNIKVDIDTWNKIFGVANKNEKPDGT